MQQAREAAARLKDYGEDLEAATAQQPRAAAGALPSAAAAFNSVDGPPAYLDPEVLLLLACVAGIAGWWMAHAQALCLASPVSHCPAPFLPNAPDPLSYNLTGHAAPGGGSA